MKQKDVRSYPPIGVEPTGAVSDSGTNRLAPVRSALEGEKDEIKHAHPRSKKRGGIRRTLRALNCSPYASIPDVTLPPCCGPDVYQRKWAMQRTLKPPSPQDGRSSPRSSSRSART
eukprot:CAMPEP_0184395656 /NCGR_PEP_ID=MMETSP0007-20130409/45416_1 /TAXON_ID=97485 /ORGANISM="Prymnesium parvum, Strain Texoma1" /LENGTH=115 /DNA_ID=CAMNT_0026747981 /DNA_START=164 /DNA_END=508 /DNA_ORIENTATION=-